MRSCLDAVIYGPMSAAKTAPALPPDKPAPEAQAGARRARNGTSGAVGLLLFVQLDSERGLDRAAADRRFRHRAAVSTCAHAGRRDATVPLRCCVSLACGAKQASGKSTRGPEVNGIVPKGGATSGSTDSPVPVEANADPRARPVRGEPTAEFVVRALIAAYGLPRAPFAYAGLSRAAVGSPTW
jgi:hypothetical protein